MLIVTIKINLISASIFSSFFDNNFVNPHTIGGFIIHILEALPSTGEIIKWNEFNFEVVDMDGMRIDKIIVKKTAED